MRGVPRTDLHHPPHDLQVRRVPAITADAPAHRGQDLRLQREAVSDADLAVGHLQRVRHLDDGVRGYHELPLAAPPGFYQLISDTRQTFPATFPHIL